MNHNNIKDTIFVNLRLDTPWSVRPYKKQTLITLESVVQIEHCVGTGEENRSRTWYRIPWRPINEHLMNR